MDKRGKKEKSRETDFIWRGRMIKEEKREREKERETERERERERERLIIDKNRCKRLTRSSKHGLR